jgi:hypothetical protein
MRNLSNLLLATALCLTGISNISAQRTAVPSTSICLEPIADAIIHQFEPAIAHGTGQNLIASRWTYSAGGGQGFYTVNSLVKFNLATIPANATITSATLTLYNCPSCYYPNHRDLGGGTGNGVQITRVAGAWSETAVTWNTKPTLGTNATDFATSSTFGELSTANLTNLDVKTLVQNMLGGTPTTINNGFEMHQLNNNDYYHSANFATRENTNRDLRPKLCITYTVPIIESCTFTPIADAVLSEVLPTTNYGTTGNNVASRWTFSPITNNYNFFSTKSLIKFDLSSIPPTAVITSATLNLYNCPTCYYPNHQDLVNLGNSVDIRRVTSAWAENTVTWSTQPTVSALPIDIKTSSIFGNGSTANLSIDVKTLIPSMLCSNNNGFEMRISNNADYYHSANFATRENTNAALRPKLCVVYYIPITKGLCPPNGSKTADINTPSNPNNNDDLSMDKVNTVKTITGFTISPNPTTGLITIQHSSSTQTVQVLDMTGKLLLSQTTNNTTQTEIDLSELAAGMYMVRTDGQTPQKVVKQ